MSGLARTGSDLALQHVWYGVRMSERKLYGEEVAKLLGIAYSTWRGYCTEKPGRRRQAPPADGTDIERGHARPWWWENTITDWNANRPGPGARRDLPPREPPADAVSKKRAAPKKKGGEGRSEAVT